MGRARLNELGTIKASVQSRSFGQSSTKPSFLPQ